MKKILITLLLLTINLSYASNFGKYKYSKYNAINQQIQNQRARAYLQQRKYYQNPTRNIRYPTSQNPYPNIDRQKNVNLTPKQRYSAQYYQRYSNY